VNNKGIYCEDDNLFTALRLVHADRAVAAAWCV